MSLDNRKDAFENKYAHDEELKFKVEARTAKLFGLYVAGLLGAEGDMAEQYAKSVVAANLEEAGYGDIKRKVIADLDEKGVEYTEHLLDRQLEIAEEEAKRQIMEASGF